MTDLALRFDAEIGACDLLLDGGALATDDGLRTAILISLFTDARASAEDQLPEENGDRRGWWGNAFPQADDQRRRELGSKLWLLSRAKATNASLNLARQTARDALQWLIDDRVAASIDVSAEWQAADGTASRLAIGVELTRPSGPARLRFDFTWEASA